MAMLVGGAFGALFDNYYASLGLIDIEEPKKEEVKKEEIKKEEVKSTHKVENKKEVIIPEVVETKREETKVTETKKEIVTEVVETKNETKDVINMQERKQSPVIKIKPVENKQVKIDVSKKSNNITSNNVVNEEEHHLHHLVDHLRSIGVNFTAPRKMPTGLIEMEIYQINEFPFTISVDINGLLYNDELKFFIGKINPSDEYNKPCIMMTNESIKAIVQGSNIPTEYYVPESLFVLNRVLDLQTLKEKDPKIRAAVLEKAAKVISDEDIYNGILKAAKGEPYRFAFCRYTSENEFSLVSSKRNLASNLDPKSNLITTKEIWINFKNNEMKLTTKKTAK